MPNDAGVGNDTDCVDDVRRCLSDHDNVSVSDCINACLFVLVRAVTK